MNAGEGNVIELRGSTEFIRTAEGMAQYLLPEIERDGSKALFVMCEDAKAPKGKGVYCALMGDRSRLVRLVASVLLSYKSAADVVEHASNLVAEVADELLKKREKNE